MPTANFFVRISVAMSFLLLATSSQAQTLSNSTSTPTPGVPRDYINLLNETVDPANGTVSLRVELPIPRGRGVSVPFSISYDSNLAHFLTATNAATTWSSNTSKGLTLYGNGGWAYFVPMLSWTSVPENFHKAPPYNGICTFAADYSFLDPSGAQHPFRSLTYFNQQSNPCHGEANPWTASSDDFFLATFSKGAAGGNLLVAGADGTTYTFLSVAAGNAGAGTLRVSSVEDRNGNQENFAYSASPSTAFTITDTLNRSVISASGFGITGDTISTSGLVNPFTLTWATATSNFSISSVQVHGPPSGSCWTPAGPSNTTDNVVTKLLLPNGQSYTFQYDSSYGQVNKIIYPSGGYVSYSWGLNSLSASIYFPGGGFPVGCLYEYDRPAILHRYISYDGSTIAFQQDFAYSTIWATNGTWTSKQTTVTNRDLVTGLVGEIIYTYTPISLLPPSWIGQPSDQQVPVEQAVVYKNAAGTVLKTINKTWYDQNELESEQTILDNGQTSKLTYTYGTGVQITEEDDYDFGATAPTRKTVTNYQAFGNTPNYPVSPSIFNKPCQTIVYDGNASRYAETDYYYDGTTSGTPCAASTTQTLSGTGQYTNHDETNYGTAVSPARANLTSAVRLCLSNCANSVTTYTYDETGQPLTSTDADGHTVSYSYKDAYSSGTPPAATNAYLTTRTDPLQHTINYTYLYADGQLASVKDANNNTTYYTYDTPPKGCSLPDGLDRLSQVNYPDGGLITYCYNDSTYNSSTPSPSVTTSKTINSSLNMTSVSAMDGMGHAVQTELTSDPDGTDYDSTVYDGFGQVHAQTNPHRSASLSTDGTTTYFYDALGRSCLVVPPDGTFPTGGTCPTASPSNDIFTTYLGSCTTTTDEAGKGRKACSDGLNRLTQVFEDPAGLDYETDYSYDPLDNLLCTAQKGTNTGTFSNCSSAPASWRPRSFSYDSLSRLTQAVNPESGTTSYSYDAYGNLMQKTSPAPNQASATTTVTLSYCYDSLNRITGKAYTAQTCSNGFLPTPLVSYFYDQTSYNGLTVTNGIGRRTGMSDQAGGEAWSYDVMGRRLADKRTTNGVTKTTSYLYLPNVDGSLNSVTYPFGLNLVYTVNGAERPTSVTGSPGSFTYVQSATYAPQGAFATIQNNTSAFPYITNYYYNSRLQPCRIAGRHTASAPTSCNDTTNIGDLLDYTYNYNSGSTDNGSVGAIANNLDATRSQNFTYDSLNRISTAQTQTTGVTIPNANCWGLTFGYDPWGNMLQSSTTGPSGCGEPAPLNVTVGNYNQIVNNNVAGQISNYCYDAAGNLIYITTPSTAPGNPCPASGPYQYVYDAENHIITTNGVTYTYDGDGKRVQKSNGRIYWFGAQSDPLEISDLSGNLIEQYVFFGGKRVARYYLTTSQLFYYFSDYLGNARKLYLTGTTGPCFDADYYPFGGERDAVTNTCAQYFKFNGKERDQESGLDYFGARYDESTIGRFLSPDPENAGATNQNPQSWNAYSYALNNPLNNIDPDGRATYICVENGNGGYNCYIFTSDAEFRAALAASAGVSVQNGKLFATVNGQQVQIGTAIQEGTTDISSDFLALYGLKGLVSVGRLAVSGVADLLSGAGADAAEEAAVQTAIVAKPTPAEASMIAELRSAGKTVEQLARIPGKKTADFLVNGVETELKTLEGSGTTTLKSAVERAAKQGEQILIDARDTKLTAEQCANQIARAQGNVGGLQGRVTVLTKDGIVNF